MAFDKIGNMGDGMNYSEYKSLKEDINSIKFQNIEETLFMFNYWLNAYVDSILTFGINSAVTKDILDFWKEFKNIILEEKNILNFLLKNYSLIDIDEANNFICELDDLNEETVNYYYKFLDDVNIACNMELEWKAKRPIKSFDTLIESDKYHKKMYGLMLSFKDIKNYLGYEEKFWDWVDSKVYIIDSRDEEDKVFYGVNIKNNNKTIEDIKVFVPKIINLDTALVNVHEFKHAYDLWNLIGKEISDEEYYENSARECENEFKNKYLVKKLEQIVK